MTRTPSRRLLALALASALAPALPAFAQSADPFSLAPATTPEPDAPAAPGAFTVSDIRIDVLQRISAGTVFTYLPIERGDTVDLGQAGDAIRALYKTGFFEDVKLDRQGDILVVTVTERPAINKLTLVGYERDECLQMMALVLAHQIRAMLRGDRPFDGAAYETMLRKLPELPEASE